MRYNFDITDSYQQFICLDSGVGLSAYFSFLDLNSIKKNSICVNINNIEVNMSDNKWFSPIITANTQSIINSGLEKVNVNEPDCIYSVILSKATLKIDNIKCIYTSFNNDGKSFYHTVGKRFDIGDQFIWLSGKSSDFANTKVSAMIVFSGYVEISFDETDVIIQSLDLNENIVFSEASLINEAQELLVSKKNRSINEMRFNNIRSNFLDYDFYSNYFRSDENGNVAIKKYIS